ncbi:MAG: hypothetical protein WA254_06970 [Candidatus Sulfotelmatobacter sp.]
MAAGAKRDQVVFGIVARAAAILSVVNFQVRHRAAPLASPTITTQHLLS